MLMPPGYLLCLQITFHCGSPWGDGINDVSITSVSLTNILSCLVEKAPWILKIFLLKFFLLLNKQESQITWSCLPYIITHVEDTEAVCSIPCNIFLKLDLADGKFFLWWGSILTWAGKAHSVDTTNLNKYPEEDLTAFQVKA